MRLHMILPRAYGLNYTQIIFQKSSKYLYSSDSYVTQLNVEVYGISILLISLFSPTPALL